jgi:hypothetical protein
MAFAPHPPTPKSDIVIKSVDLSVGSTQPRSDLAGKRFVA